MRGGRISGGEMKNLCMLENILIQDLSAGNSPQTIYISSPSPSSFSSSSSSPSSSSFSSSSSSPSSSSSVFPAMSLGPFLVRFLLI